MRLPPGSHLLVTAFRNSLGSLPRTTRRLFIAGLVVLLPLTITYLILRFIFDTIDPIVQPGVRAWLGREIPGLGVASVAVLVLLLGGIVTNRVGRAIVGWVETVLVLRIPVVRAIYRPALDAIAVLSRTRGDANPFRRVVLFDYPRAGTKTLGFVTGEFHTPGGNVYLTIYVPTVPVPTTGFLLFVPEAETEEAGIGVDAAIRLMVSGGILSAREARGPAPSALDAP